MPTACKAISPQPVDTLLVLGQQYILPEMMKAEGEGERHSNSAAARLSAIRCRWRLKPRSLGARKGTSISFYLKITRLTTLITARFQIAGTYWRTPPQKKTMQVFFLKKHALE